MENAATDGNSSGINTLEITDYYTSLNADIYFFQRISALPAERKSKLIIITAGTTLL